MNRKQSIDKDRSIGGLQALLATVRGIDPATTAELGALHSLRMHVAAPLHQMIEEALTWLENIDALVTEQMPSLGLAAPASSLPASWRVLWQVSFSAQCELTEAARDLDLTGCGWEEGLQRCETAARQVKESLRQVVGAVQDLDHLERLEANTALASLGLPGGATPRAHKPPTPAHEPETGRQSWRQRLARGSEPSLPTPDYPISPELLTGDPALRPTERYPEQIIEQLCAESERESLEVRTIAPPERVRFRAAAEGSGPVHPRARSIHNIKAPLTLDFD